MSTELKRYRASPEREKIFQVLSQSAVAFPSAEWVFQTLKNQGEKISLATVYRNLGILCDQHKIKKLDVLGEKEVRYDACTKPKGYLVCKKHKKILNTQNPKELQQPSQRFDSYFVCTDCDYRN